MRKKKEPTKWTMLSAMESIWKAAKDSELSEDLFKTIKEPAEYVRQKFGINPVQSVFLSIFLDAEDNLQTRQIASFLDCSNISILAKNADLEDLCKRHMIRPSSFRRRGEKVDGYCVEEHCLECVKADIEYIVEDMSKVSHWHFMQRVAGWLDETDRNSCNYGRMCEDISYLVSGTQHLKLSKFLFESVESGQLSTAEMVFFLIACNVQIIRRMRSMTPCEYEDIMEESYCCADICEGINEGTGPLAKMNLLEPLSNDGIANMDVFRVTKDACSGLLSDYKVPYNGDKINPALDVLLQPADIVSKKLFFNPEEGKQIERLRDLLSSEKFSDVQKRLKESGLRSGFCVLMHGIPGSGKTESVYQVCKESGHPIYQVNISELKSKWVGDSEKQVQGMFNKYRSMVDEAVRMGTPIPVLFLNEADAIMGRRMKGEQADSSVSKMENALQNIILQGMERLEGVLVATTNLTDNLDEAMTRRWIFTIRYDKPSAEVKAKIFKEMIPELSANEAKILSEEFPDFCGGQCENVTRRLKVEHVLYNTPFSLDRVRQLCKEEGIHKSDTRKSIGFR